MLPSGKRPGDVKYESTAIHSVKLVTQNIFNFLLILIKK